MDKWVCKVCGYIYDSEFSDENQKILSGTDFKDLPDNRVCPVYGAPKTCSGW
jgi:rubredoxin